MFDFQLLFEVDGLPQRWEFMMVAPSLADAVRKSLRYVSLQSPGAEFRGLTYYHPPLQ